MVGVLAREVLVVFLRGIELLRTFDANHDRLVPDLAGAHLRKVGARDLALLRGERNDRGAILRAYVRTLAVLERRIGYYRKQHAQQLIIPDDRWIVSHLHGLGMAGASCRDEIVFGRRRAAAVVARNGARHALGVAEHGLDAPEASAGKDCGLQAAAFLGRALRGRSIEGALGGGGCTRG